MAVSSTERGGLRRVFLATATMGGICAIRAMAFATLLSLGSVDCVSSEYTLSLR